MVIALTSELRTWPTAYGPITQRMIFANLLRDVIRAGKCIYCGSCSAVCPTLAVQMLEDVPRLLGICIKCGYCYYACPETIEEGFKGFDEYKEEIDKRIFKLSRKEPFGVYRKIYVLKSIEDEDAFRDEAIIKVIMSYGLKKGYWDVVGYAGRDKPVTDGLLNYKVSGWRGRPSIAFREEDILNAKLKLITPGPTLLSVRGSVEELRGGYFHGSDPIRVAVFGPPQHIRSIWKGRFSWAGHIKLLKTIVFIVSYFNRKFYLPSKLNVILSKDGLSLDNIEDIRYSKDHIEFKSNGGWKRYSFDDLKEAEHPGYSNVKDFTGEYADLSIGILDDIEGVIIIARTEEGVKIVDEMISEGVLEVLDVDVNKVLDSLRRLYGDVK